MAEAKRIFSGDASRAMWRAINRSGVVTNDPIAEALYLLGCKCQGLETVVRKLEKEVKRG